MKSLRNEDFELLRQDNEDVVIIHINPKGVYNFVNGNRIRDQILENQEIIKKLRKEVDVAPEPYILAGFIQELLGENKND